MDTLELVAYCTAAVAIGYVVLSKGSLGNSRGTMPSSSCASARRVDLKTPAAPARSTRGLSARAAAMATPEEDRLQTVDEDSHAVESGSVPTEDGAKKARRLHAAMNRDKFTLMDASIKCSNAIGETPMIPGKTLRLAGDQCSAGKAKPLNPDMMIAYNAAMESAIASEVDKAEDDSKATADMLASVF